MLFPGALMPLHIFEPRYRLLIRRCRERQQPFGIVLIRSGAEVGATAEPYAVGTEARIVAESPLPDGRSYIVTRGERRFSVEALIADAEPYLVGRVRYLDEPAGDGAEASARTALEALGAYLLAVVAVTDEAGAERALTDELRGASPGEVAYRIAGSLAVDPAQLQRLLELESAAARLAEETRILDHETEILRELLMGMRERGERRDLN